MVSSLYGLMAGEVFPLFPVCSLSVPGTAFSFCRGIPILLMASQKSKFSFRRRSDKSRTGSSVKKTECRIPHSGI
jgi:hypothetical protein